MATRRSGKRTKSRLITAARFARKHPLLTLATLLGTVAGIVLDYWLAITMQAQGIASLTVFASVFVVYVLATIGYGGIYIVMGLHPLSGYRTCIYVGLTSKPPWVDYKGRDRYPRIETHIFGSDYYGEKRKPWSDTVTDWHYAHESWFFLFGLLKFLEFANIKLRKPLYNTLMNMDNPQRIDKHRAAALRAERDQGIYTEAYYAAMIEYGIYQSSTERT